jgi:Flp pilus assembly protein TadG
LKTTSRHSERGVAAVELALLLPMFGLLLLGVIEVGGMARDFQVVQNAAREGARFSALDPQEISGVAAVETRIKDRIIAYLANERITVAAGDISIDQTYTITISGINVTCSKVDVTYARPVMFKGIGAWFPLSTTNLKGQAIFRNFY